MVHFAINGRTTTTITTITTVQWYGKKGELFFFLPLLKCDAALQTVVTDFNKNHSFGRQTRIFHHGW
jgi:hypothetical protein